MIRLQELALRIGEPESRLKGLAAGCLRIRPADIAALKLVRRSIDARKQPIRRVYTVDLTVKGNEASILRRARCKKASIAPEEIPYAVPTLQVSDAARPVVVGFGPAGMFAALVLAMAGLRPIVLERGSRVDVRQEKVEAFFDRGALDPECNVQFGEGGAGTFSDGKLNTGTHDPRIRWVLERFAAFGAGEDVCIDAKPHVGTDVLRQVVRNLREEVIRLGGEVRFDTRMDGLLTENGALIGIETAAGTVPCRAAVLALGHSARDSFRMLQKTGLPMQPKAFSMGVRIEHPQAYVDQLLYGQPHQGQLPPADYKLSVRLPDGSSAYTFCMCPGGYVVAAASEAGGVVTNGMSYSGRAGENANSALLVTVTPEDFPPGDDPLRGMEWQRSVEQAAFLAGGGDYHAPCQTVGEFLGISLEGSAVQPTYRPGTTPADLRQVLPKKVADVLARALPKIGWGGRFALPEAMMTAPETRSSSPVRILRGPDLQSPALRGLFPCGEGAGYAGGIVSAAVDGMRCAEALITAMNEKEL